MTRQEISKRACAKYVKRKGDEPQQMFRYGLNRFILAGLSETEAEAQALILVRKNHPDFVPLRVSTQAFISALARRT